MARSRIGRQQQVSGRPDSIHERRPTPVTKSYDGLGRVSTISAAVARCRWHLHVRPMATCVPALIRQWTCTSVVRLRHPESDDVGQRRVDPIRQCRNITSRNGSAYGYVSGRTVWGRRVEEPIYRFCRHVRISDGRNMSDGVQYAVFIETAPHPNGGTTMRTFNAFARCLGTGTTLYLPGWSVPRRPTAACASATT